MEDQNVVHKLPRGQAQLNARARKVVQLPRHVKWGIHLSKADVALIRRAGNGKPVLRKNLPRLAEVLIVAERTYQGFEPVLNRGVPYAAGASLAPEGYVSPLDAIAQMLKIVPDARVKWHGLTMYCEEEIPGE